MKIRLDKSLGESFPPWTLHDLRRTCATGMQRLHVRPDVIEAVLNHVSGSRGGISGVYQRYDWQTEKLNALDLWARHVVALVEIAKSEPRAQRRKGPLLGSSKYLNDPLLQLYISSNSDRGGKRIARQRVQDGTLPAHNAEKCAKAVDRLKKNPECKRRIAVLEQGLEEWTEALEDRTRTLLAQSCA
jgi:hypothetical protein